MDIFDFPLVYSYYSFTLPLLLIHVFKVILLQFTVICSFILRPSYSFLLLFPAYFSVIFPVCYGYLYFSVRLFYLYLIKVEDVCSFSLDDNPLVSK